MNTPTLEDMISSEKILQTMHECENGVRWKASIQHFEIDTLIWAARIRNSVRDGSYKTKGFRHFDIVERGKLRHIQSVHVSERTVQKLLCNYALKPVINPMLIYDNSASQKYKGTEFALKRLKEHLRWHYARYGKKGSVLVMDYHDFFASIPHDKAIKAISIKQDDPLILKYISDFVNAFKGDKGLGLGSEISQIGAIWYPGKLDKMIKEKLKVHCYARYMDDSYIIHPDRKYLEYCLKEIQKFASEYGIQINMRKTKIHNLASDDFVFLKKRIHLTESGKIIFKLTKRNIKDERKRIQIMRKEYQMGNIPIESVLQSYQSWRNYAKKCNSYKTVGTMDRYFTSVFGDILKTQFGNRHINYGHPNFKCLAQKSVGGKTNDDDNYQGKA